jgi:Ca2+/H+ antiporter
VTIIEVALIVSVMVAAPAEKAGLARDTVFAAVMIVCNDIVGLCLLWGGARHHEQGFQVHGASAALAVLAALARRVGGAQAARANQLQTSLNLALGSALASIGLTIPVVAGVSIVMHQPLELGLGTKDEVLLALTLLTGVITLGTGRTTVLQGIVHLVIFAVFLFFAVVP